MFLFMFFLSKTICNSSVQIESDFNFKVSSQEAGKVYFIQFLYIIKCVNLVKICKYFCGGVDLGNGSPPRAMIHPVYQ